MFLHTRSFKLWNSSDVDYVRGLQINIKRPQLIFYRLTLCYKPTVSTGCRLAAVRPTHRSANEEDLTDAENETEIKSIDEYWWGEACVREELVLTKKSIQERSVTGAYQTLRVVGDFYLTFAVIPTAYQQRQRPSWVCGAALKCSETWPWTSSAELGKWTGAIFCLVGFELDLWPLFAPGESAAAANTNRPVASQESGHQIGWC